MRRLRVIRGWKDLPAGDRGAAVAMGNFDGVHRGHQQVIALAAKAAGELGCPLGVITFDPHPRVYFRPDEPAFHLIATRPAGARARSSGGRRALCPAADARACRHDDREFAARVLHEGWGVRHVAVGFDNSFGKGRTGSPQDHAGLWPGDGLRRVGGRAVADGSGEKFSSTAVREALREEPP